MTEDLLSWTPPDPYPARGDTFEADRDGARLSDQAQKVHDATVNRGWLTLKAISDATGAPEASASARLRDLRGFGFKVARRYVSQGLWEYEVTKRDAR